MVKTNSGRMMVNPVINFSHSARPKKIEKALELAEFLHAFRVGNYIGKLMEPIVSTNIVLMIVTPETAQNISKVEKAGEKMFGEAYLIVEKEIRKVSDGKVPHIIFSFS